MNTQLESSIVRIRKPNGTVVGAGFLASEKYVITCAHVVAQALGIPEYDPQKPQADVNLDFPRAAPGENLTARVIIWREVQKVENAPPPEDGEDIAVLEIKQPLPIKVKPARIISKENIEKHRFSAYGFPRGNDNGGWAYGVLGRPVHPGWVQIEGEKETGLPLECGFSGTPIWDEKLKGVVGIAVAADLERVKAKVAFMIPTQLLVKAWSPLGELILPYWRKILQDCGKHRGRLASLALIPILGGTSLSFETVREAIGIEQPTCFEQALREGKKAIALANIYEKTANQNPQLLTKDNIEDELSKQEIFDVKVCSTDESFSTNKQAQNFGNRQDIKAAIVIWGRRDAAGLIIQVTTLNSDIKNFNNLLIPANKIINSTLYSQELPRLITILTAFGLSEIYRKEGQIIKAQSILDSPLKNYSSSTKFNLEETREKDLIFSRAYFFLGVLYNNQIKSPCSTNRDLCKKALEAYENASKIDKTYYEAMFNQAYFYEELGDFQNAEKVYTKIIDSNPETEQALQARQYREELYLQQNKAIKSVAD